MNLAAFISANPESGDLISETGESESCDGRCQARGKRGGAGRNAIAKLVPILIAGVFEWIWEEMNEKEKR